ncbi:MAG: PP2C family protein-serine/threonine phosphatase [Candidatus Eiseniibacteriota bacterium]
MIEGRHYAARQSQGARNYQEDEFGFLAPADAADDRPHSLLAVLADGMGGHKGGAHASAAAVDAFLKAYDETDLPTAERLRRALGYANERIGADSHGNPDLEGMGCTLVGAAFTEAGLQWISVGDSPFWLYRDGKLIRLNEDHSMAPILAEQVRQGKLTADEAAHHPQRNALRSAVIGDTLPLIDLKEQPIALEPGDRLVLSSDGLETLAEDEIAAVLREGADDGPELLAERLLAAVEARNKKGQDNTTVIVVEPFGPGGRADAVDLQTIIPERAGRKRAGGGGRGTVLGAAAIVVIVLAAVFAWQRGLPPFSWMNPKAPVAATEGQKTPAPGSNALPGSGTAPDKPATGGDSDSKPAPEQR